MLSIVLTIIILILSTVILILVSSICKTKYKIREMVSILEEIKNGNEGCKIFMKEKSIVAELGFSINDLVESFRTKVRIMKRAEQSSKELLTSLSHDVRTPLTSLLGYLEAVNDGVVFGEEKEEYLEIAKNKAYELNQFVNTLFEWFKLDSRETKFSMQKIDIDELTRSLIIEWLPVFEKNNIKPKILIDENECFVNVDCSSYKRIINNLVQNAIYHSGGDSIIIESEKKEYEVLIKISDNGKGIENDKIPFLFNRMYKCDESRTKYGSGLGLAIVKELVTIHGGEIIVASELGLNTTFTVSLPIA